MKVKEFVLPADLAQEILNILAELPAKQVFEVIVKMKEMKEVVQLSDEKEG